MTEEEIQKARESDAKTLYKIGDSYYKKNKENDYKKAYAWLHKAALQDYTEAQAKLGLMYNWGMGVSEDYKKSMKWSMKAASAGNDNAQYNIALLYYFGRGVSIDDKKVMYWYLKAAKNGNADAMYNIGYIYEDGDGVTESISTAIE